MGDDDSVGVQSFPGLVPCCLYCRAKTCFGYQKGHRGRMMTRYPYQQLESHRAAGALQQTRRYCWQEYVDIPCSLWGEGLQWIPFVGGKRHVSWGYPGVSSWRTQRLSRVM